MKRIALVGPYNDNTRAALHQNVPEGFEMIDVPTVDDYALLKDADYVIIRTIKLDKADIEGTKVKHIQKWGAGYDRIDAKGIGELNVSLAICNGINSQPVAEMAVLHMLALYRNFIAINSKLRAHEWAKDQYSNRAYIINGKTVGVIGYGNIGSKVARIVKGFGAKVVYNDLQPCALAAETDAQFLPLEELLKVSDIVTVHVPLDDSTRGMINRDRLSLMKPSALLINTARGEVVVDEDLAQALRTGVIAGAGLDAISKEPPDDSWPFYTMENVVYTPHTGGNTADNDINMIHRCFENICRVDAGVPLRERDLVNNAFLPEKREVEHGV